MNIEENKLKLEQLSSDRLSRISNKYLKQNPDLYNGITLKYLKEKTWINLTNEEWREIVIQIILQFRLENKSLNQPFFHHQLD
jgi:hypothetical protein